MHGNDQRLAPREAVPTRKVAPIKTEAVSSIVSPHTDKNAVHVETENEDGSSYYGEQE